MSSAPQPAEIWADARWLAQALDPRAGLMRIVSLCADDYRQASFLDDRILQEGHSHHLVNWAEIEQERPADTRTDVRWIFHIGHVGSTLISRLLGELESVLAVREPRSFRDLTFFPRGLRDSFVPTVRALMSRTFAAEQTVVVKATSMVSEIAAELVGANGRTLFLYTSAETYLRTILAGDSSPGELQMLAGYYAARAERARIPLNDAPPGQTRTAAVVWACEMTALESAAQGLPGGSVLWLDFDEFLRQPGRMLNQIVRYLGLPADDNRIAEIASGPLMNRYSKALDYEFGPEARRQLLEQAGAKHALDIAAALAMLNQAAEKAPLLARALLRSTSDR